MIIVIKKYIKEKRFEQMILTQMKAGETDRVSFH